MKRELGETLLGETLFYQKLGETFWVKRDWVKHYWANCYHTLRPNGQRELSTPIKGQESWDSKPCNPGRHKCSGTGLSSDGGEGNSFWPPGGPVNHGEDITEALAGRKRTDQIQVNM